MKTNIRERIAGWLSGKKEFIFRILPRILAVACLAVSALFVYKCTNQINL